MCRKYRVDEVKIYAKDQGKQCLEYYVYAGNENAGERAE